MADAELREILDSVDIESYLDTEGLDYRPAQGSSGAQLNLRECPKCGGSKWKVYIGADSGLGNCFHGDCEAKFNKFSFIRAHMGDMEVRKFIDYLKGVAASQGWRPPRKRSVATNTETAIKLPAHHKLPINGRNLAYLASRDVSIDLANYFGLLYCHEGKYWYDYEGQRKRQIYDGRIIIPVFDMDGEMVTFQGRDITGTAEKKYLFPSGIASTGAHLYNIQNASGVKRAVIGEGAFDVIAIKRALDEDPTTRDIVALGSFGKHLSHGSPNGSDQIGKLIKLKALGLEEVTFMWDGEPQALEDACDAALMVRQVGLIARIAILPAGRDPNEVAPSVVRAAYWKAIHASNSSVTKIRMELRAGKVFA